MHARHPHRHVGHARHCTCKWEKGRSQHGHLPAAWTPVQENLHTCEAHWRCAETTGSCAEACGSNHRGCHRGSCRCGRTPWAHIEQAPPLSAGSRLRATPSAVAAGPLTAPLTPSAARARLPAPAKCAWICLAPAWMSSTITSHTHLSLSRLSLSSRPRSLSRSLSRLEHQIKMCTASDLPVVVEQFCSLGVYAWAEQTHRSRSSPPILNG